MSYHSRTGKHTRAKSNQIHQPAFHNEVKELIQIKFLKYYLRYSWFLFKKACSRTMSLPIGLYVPPSLEKEYQNSPILVGTTLGLFSYDNYLRRTIAAVFRSETTDLFLTFLMFFHWGTLLSFSWKADERKALNYSDDHTRLNLEAFGRMIVGGLFKNGIKYPKVRESEAVFGHSKNINHRVFSTRSAYFRRSFNRLDLICIVCYWTNFVLEHLGWNTLFFLSALSSLKIFRLLNFPSGFRVILKSLKISAPLLANVALLIGFFVLTYSVIGITFFRTSLKTRCFAHDYDSNTNSPLLFERFCGSYINQDGVRQHPYFISNYTSFSTEKFTYGYVCPLNQICLEHENPTSDLTSFDDIFQAFIFVLIIGSGQSWSDILYQLQEATSKWSTIYVVLILLTLNFWLFNMFMAVITETFSTLRSSKNDSYEDENYYIDLFEHSLMFENEDLECHEIGYSESQSSVSTYFNPGYKYRVYNNRWFKRFWILLIFTNLIVLGFRDSESTLSKLQLCAFIELSISFLFCIEIAIRYFMWSSHIFFYKDINNIIDFTLACINLSATSVNALRSFPEYRFLVLFQLLRSYRIIWFFPNLRILITKIAGSLDGIMNMVLFVFTITFLSSAVAMQLFGGTIPYKGTDNLVIFQRFDNVGWSFLALYQVFSGEDWPTILYLTMEGQKNWHTSYASVLFIFMFFALSNFLLFNLFVAVLVENLTLSEVDKRKIQLQGYFEGLQSNYKRVNVYLSPWNVYRYIKPEPHCLKIKGLPKTLVLSVDQANAKQLLGNKSPEETITSGLLNSSKLLSFKIFSFFKSKIKSSSLLLHQPLSISGLRDSETDIFIPKSQTRLEKNPIPSFHHADVLARDEFCEAHPTYDKSLFIFSKKSPIRLLCQVLVGCEHHPEYPFKQFTVYWFLNQSFSLFMVVSVIINVFFTLIETPLVLRDEAKRLAFDYINGFFLIVFSMDVSINIIAEGFLFTPYAYLHSTWNRIYFFALIVCFVDFSGVFTQADGIGRVVRAAKAFRVIRLINFSETAKFTLHAVLVSGFWKLFDAASIALCFLIPWAIYLMNVFSNRFQYCNDETVYGISDCIGNFFDPRFGILIPRSWQNPWMYSFDNFISALRILFEITSGGGWVDVMETSMKITGLGRQPKEYNSLHNAIFFVVFNFVVSVSIHSLVVSIVIDNFTTRSGSALLAVEQRRWKDLAKLLRSIAPPKVRRNLPTNPIIKRMYDIVIKKKSWYTRFMSIVYVSILFLLATERAGVSLHELTIKSWILFSLLVTCFIEVIFHLIALSPRVFFSNFSNTLHFILVSIATISAAILSTNHQFRNLYNVVNLFSVLVALRCMPRFDGLLRLIKTLKASLTSILNIFFVWLILFLIYATGFIQVFGLTKVGVNGTTDMANFMTPENALVMLTRFSEGETWNNFMYDFTIQEPYCVVDDPNNFEMSDCGSPAWSFFLFLTFNIMSMYIFSNMFVGVIVDSFSSCYELSDNDLDDNYNGSMLDRGQARSFKSTWIYFDPKRTGYLKPEDIVPFLLNLGHPFENKIYQPLYSIETLTRGSFYIYQGSKAREKSGITIPSSNDRDPDSLNLKVLNSLLRTMNAEDCKIKRRRFNLIYQEFLIFVKPGKGVQFTDALMILARHYLVNPNVAFEIGELIEYNKIKEQVYSRVCVEKVVGILKMLTLRRRFLRHLDDKHAKERKAQETAKDIVEKATDISLTIDPSQSHESIHDGNKQDMSISSMLNFEDESIDPAAASQYFKHLQENSFAKLLNLQTKNL